MQATKLTLEDWLVNQRSQANKFVARINQVLQTHPEQIFLRDRFLTFALHRSSLSLQENAGPDLKIRQTDDCDYPIRLQFWCDL